MSLIQNIIPEVIHFIKYYVKNRKSDSQGHKFARKCEAYLH
jgi:hypothetical protein